MLLFFLFLLLFASRSFHRRCSILVHRQTLLLLLLLPAPRAPCPSAPAPPPPTFWPRREEGSPPSAALSARPGKDRDGAPSTGQRASRHAVNQGSGSSRGSGRIPRGRGVGARWPECVSSPASSLPALFSCPRRALSGSTLFALWWSFSASSCTAVRTCRCHARRRRSLRRSAAPLPRSPSMTTAMVRNTRNLRSPLVCNRLGQTPGGGGGGGKEGGGEEGERERGEGVVVLLLLTCDSTNVSVKTHQ